MRKRRTQVYYNQAQTAGHPLQGLMDTLPPDDGIERQFGRPKFHPDGNIEYPKKGDVPPPDIDGYQQDPVDRWLYIPLWPDCPKRMQGTAVSEDGSVQVKMACNHPLAKCFQQAVEFKQCAECPLASGRQ